MLNKLQLAEKFSVSEMTINRWVKKGMPHLKAPNGTIRFELEKVKEWMGGK